METPSVIIKGTSFGLVISLGEGPWEALLEELQARLESKASFFLGGRVALCVGDRVLTPEQLLAAGRLLERAGMTLWAVDSDHPSTHLAAAELGLETSLRSAEFGSFQSGPRARLTGEAEPTDGAAQPEQPTREEMPGMVTVRTLRSGQELHFVGHITLIGDVNPGAEVMAAGDVVVWGKLRGRVHAGALGDDGAVVCALQLAPSQIRIGSHIAQPPERARLPKAPEIASVQEGGIVVERWDR